MRRTQNTLTVLTLRWRILLQVDWIGQMSMTDTDTTQDNFILPAPHVGGLPISQDQLDRMKFVRNLTIPIILPSGKNILTDTMFKSGIGYTNLGKFGSLVCLFVIPNTSKAGYLTKKYVFTCAFPSWSVGWVRDKESIYGSIRIRQVVHWNNTAIPGYVSRYNN